MSRIDLLIAELCPEGVEHKPLGEVGTFTRGGGLQKKDFVEEGVGCFHYGQVYTHYGIWATETLSFVTAEFAENKRKVRPGDIFIATTSENDEDLGKAVAWLGDDDIVASGDAYIFRHSLDAKYVSYFLSSASFQEQKKRWITGAKVRRISGSALEKILIPTPPIEIQRAIVSILDKFTKLEAELEAELEARKKQYAHYRNRLFIDLDHKEPRRALGELGDFQRGSTLQKKHFTDAGVPCIHYGQVYTHYGVSAYETKSFVSEEFARGKRVLQPGDVFVATTSENEEDLGKAVAWLGSHPAVASSDAFIYRSELDARFVAHFFASDHFNTQKKRFITGAKVKRLSDRALRQIAIPVPELNKQKDIANTLDKFDALVNDLSSGLPAEIAARRKQYEYYRDQLLTFKELEA